MPHQIGKERYVVEFREKILGETMPERVGIDNICVNAIPFGECLQLIADSTSGDTLAESVAEEIAACLPCLCEPFVRLGFEAFRDVESAQLAALAVEVEETSFNVFYLDLQKFRNAGACSAKVAHDKVPVRASIGLELAAEEAVIRIADDILQKVLLLNLDELHFQSRLLDEVEVTIQGL